MSNNKTIGSLSSLKDQDNYEEQYLTMTSKYTGNFTKEEAKSRLNFQMIDDIFDSWCQEWGSKQQPRVPLDMKTTGLYHFRGIPFRFTTFDYKAEEEGRWRNIKLCNDGYCYDLIPLPLLTISRHSNIFGWNELSEFASELPKMVKFFHEHCGDEIMVKIWYNVREKRIDIKCWGEKSLNIIVTFEPGYREQEHLIGGVKLTKRT